MILKNFKGRDLSVNFRDEQALSKARLQMLAGLSGFFAVALGAFGAHALRPILIGSGTLDVWSTASLYHLVHSAGMMCIALGQPRARLSFFFFFAGVVLFCGALYIFALSGLKALGMLAPVGGLCFLAGWGSLAVGMRNT